MPLYLRKSYAFPSVGKNFFSGYAAVLPDAESGGIAAKIHFTGFGKA